MPLLKIFPPVDEEGHSLSFVKTAAVSALLAPSLIGVSLCLRHATEHFIKGISLNFHENLMK